MGGVVLWSKRRFTPGGQKNCSFDILPLAFILTIDFPYQFNFVVSLFPVSLGLTFNLISNNWPNWILVSECKFNFSLLILKV